MILEMADGSKITIPDEKSMVLCMMNGRFGGTGVPFAPVSLLNDGLLDLIFHHGPAKLMDYIDFLTNGIVGKGKHLYMNNYTYIRARKMIFLNKNYIQNDDEQNS